MATRVQVTIDCADPARLAEFWALALGYELQEPPAGFDSWPAALTSWGVPESMWNSASAVVDPAGSGPRIFFQQVPERKTGKNRLHLDVGVSDGPETPADLKRSQVMPTVARLTEAGATEVRQVEEMHSFWVVMTDPEGNEFCVT
ncbi:MAG: VOC family protein [Actinomycetota bacterium]|nr:VOC family protein [Actinomycetota bacterium]